MPSAARKLPLRLFAIALLMSMRASSFVLRTPSIAFSKRRRTTSHSLVSTPRNDIKNKNNVVVPPADPLDPPDRPLPAMPSLLFQELAQSQLELLASSLTTTTDKEEEEEDGTTTATKSTTISSKVKSMALYLPQENAQTGQLEFLPAVLYPNPTSERIFIAPQADSGMAATLPPTLSKLPGFAHATTLLPGYPMIMSSSSSSSSTTSATNEQESSSTAAAAAADTAAGVGVVEEVFLWEAHARRSGTTNAAASPEPAPALSAPLLFGSQTVGVLLVTPSPSSSPSNSAATSTSSSSSVWTDSDREQVRQGAKSLSLALSMDVKRAGIEAQKQQAYEALSDTLHQVKNPLQALRTYSKLLQRQLADSSSSSSSSDDTHTSPPQQRQPSGVRYPALELAQHLMVQSDRIVDRLQPVDSIVESLSSEHNQTPALLLRPAEVSSLVPWSPDNANHVPSDIITATSPVDLQKEEGSTTRNGITLPAPQTTTTTTTTTGKETKRQTPQHLVTSLLQDCQPEICFVEDVLDPIVTAFSCIAADQGIDFRVNLAASELPGVYIVPLAVQEAVTNVLDNAFKYVGTTRTTTHGDVASRSPPRVRLDVFANADPRRPGVTLRVQDNGPGIRAEERDAVFERGYRGTTSMTSSADSSSLSLNGNGIGLFLAKALIHQIGGDLKLVDNTHNNNGNNLGTTMEITLYRNPTV